MSLPSQQAGVGIQGCNQFPSNNAVEGMSNLLLQQAQSCSPWSSLPALSQQKSGIPPGQRRTLLDTLAEMPGMTKQDMIFVVVHAKRSSSSEAWGLAFSMFDDRIVIGKVNDNGKHVMKWCHSIRARDCLLDSNVVFSRMFWSWDTPTTYSQRLQAYARAYAFPDAMHQQLWPGDLLLSMDGYDAMHFQSLTGFTNYLRKVDQFTMILLRHPQASMSAMKLWDPRMYNGMPPPPEAAFQAATAANFAWKQITSSSTMARNSSLASHLSTLQPSIVRHVTPEQTVPATNSPGLDTVAFGGPRTLFEPVVQKFANPLDLLCQVADSCHASSNSFQATRQKASITCLKSSQGTTKATRKASSVAETKRRIRSSWRNPWFKDHQGNNIRYEDNFEFSPEDGERAELFLSTVDSFPAWLAARKHTWRRTYKLSIEYERPSDDLTFIHDFWIHQSSNSFHSARQASIACLKSSQGTTKGTRKASSVAETKRRIRSSWRNPWFKDHHGNNIHYEDNFEFSPEDGERAELFLSTVDSFPAWLAARQRTWRHQYKLSIVDERPSDDLTVNHDFWTHQGFASFDDWMASSLKKWKLSYSWNKTKTQRIQQECDEVVHISQEVAEFRHWLRIRRNQWRLLRRKRRRERLEGKGPIASEGSPAGLVTLEERPEERTDNNLGQRKRRKQFEPMLTDFDAIDEILEREEEERRRRQFEKRRLLDLSFLFDASLGAPDDVVVHCFSFLESKEYSKLLRLNKAYATTLKAREEVWKRLCPSHWILPRRPRKPWHELYFHRLRIEQRDSQKLWDDLLLECSTVLFKGDQLQAIEKLVQQGEKDFGFHVNYVSPVVCERNSILNLAVIHQRHKVVRWLVEQKQADIESYDRGHFTALLNAAWAGDRQLVRYFLRRGADRSKIGYGHYTTALAHPDFKGLTAEGWARRKGHDDIANLIRLGL